MKFLKEHVYLRSKIRKGVGFFVATFLFIATLSNTSLPAQAAGLTSLQISSILNLLQSFGADSTVISNVSAALNGQPTSGTDNPSACIDLTYNLYSGSTDTKTNGDVSRLQKFLGLNATGYFGPATEQAVQDWQSSHGVVTSGSPDTNGYGYVGAKTRKAMGCGEQQSVTVPTITITSNLPAKGSIDTFLRVPSKYANSYVVYVLNPVKTSIPVSSGALLGMAYNPSGKDVDGYSAHLSIASAHEGFAVNQGGVHWFSVPSGTYQVTAVFYPKSPFKPGTDMEYMDIGTEPGSLTYFDSKPFEVVTNSNDSLLNTPTISITGTTRPNVTFSYVNIPTSDIQGIFLVGTNSNVTSMPTNGGTGTGSMLVPESAPAGKYFLRVLARLNNRTIVESTPFDLSALVPTLGEVKAYFNGATTPLTSADTVTREYAVSFCDRSHATDPNASKRCTWNNTEIFTSTPTSPTATISQGAFVSFYSVMGFSGKYAGAAKLQVDVLDSNGRVVETMTEDDENFSKIIGQSCTPVGACGRWSASFDARQNPISLLNGIYTVTVKDIGTNAVLTTSKITLDAPTPTTIKGDLKGYANYETSPFYTVPSLAITQSDALASCKNMAQNNTWVLRCVWNGQEIFNDIGTKVGKVEVYVDGATTPFATADAASLPGAASRCNNGRVVTSCVWAGEKLFTNTTTNTSTSTIIGYTDEVRPNGDGSYSVLGWACSTGFDQSIGVHLYVGGEAGTPGSHFYTKGIANLSSEPAVANVCQSHGTNNRFNLSLGADAVRAYGGKPFAIHGISPVGKSNLVISNDHHLMIPNAPTATLPIKHTLAVGWTGEEVTTLQQTLKQLGLFKESITGYFGQATKAAVQTFQHQNNLAAVGVVGPRTREALGR